MSNELRELNAQSAEFSKRIVALRRISDAERIRTAGIAAQLTDQGAQADKTKYPERETSATDPARHRPEVKNVSEVFVMIEAETSKILSNQADTKLDNAFESKKITRLPLEANNPLALSTLQPSTTRDGYVAGGRAAQTNATLDGVDVEPSNTQTSIPRNTSSGGDAIVRGTVKDPNGKIVSGAIVTLSDPTGNFTRTQHTNKDGAYVFNAMTPGTYYLQVSASGFKTASASDLATLVNTLTVLDVQLEVGSVSETVNVSAAAEAAINTSDATVENSFQRKRITELPSITLDGSDATIRIPGYLTWIRFQLALETAAIHEDYRVTIKTADGRTATSVDWSEPLTPNQTIIETPAISTGDLPPSDYVLLLLGKELDGSLVKVAEYAFKVIK
jgi:hypothetical protein